jgi:hypothetical protein
VSQQAIERYTQTIEALKEAFPAREWTAPSGKIYHGTALPENLLSVSRDDPSSNIKGNLLNIAISMPGGITFIPWLLASGFDPRAFNPHTHNAPIGAMAYTGNHQCLAICREAGFDLSLLVEPQHYPDMDPQKKGTDVGSTLLHRIAQRFDRIEGAGDVMRELLMAGVDPYAQNGAGETALMWARGDAQRILNSWIADLQSQQLQDTVASTHHTRSMPRL